jgi:transcriptional regulator with XRE-family HTH domain
MESESGVNAQLLKFLRKQLGWTQEELGARAELSARVIAKAESGQSVSRRTVDALADAFSEAGESISSADLIADPESLTRQFLKNYALHQAEVVPASCHFLSPDVVAFVDGDPATNPIAGTYLGVDAFDALWRKFFAIFVRDGGTLAEKPEIRSIGNEVVVWGHEHIRVPEVEPQPPGFVMLRIRYSGGMMTHFENYYEASGMMRALAEWSKEFPDAPWVATLQSQAQERTSQDESQ